MANVSGQTNEAAGNSGSCIPDSTASGATRIKSEDLLRDQREIEIEHQGRIYRLRVTQLNKLILTA